MWEKKQRNGCPCWSEEVLTVEVALSTRVSTVGSNGHGSEWGSGAASSDDGCYGSEMEG